LLDKSESRRTAESLGISMPRRYGPARAENLAAKSIAYPVVVKPLASHLFFQRFATKLFVAHDADELMRAVECVEATGLEAEVQECIPGPDGQVVQYAVYVDAKGEPVAERAYRKLRQAPPGFGVASAAELVDAPELREPTLSLLREVGWRGIAAAEFKRDPRDGQFKLFEVNGRCFLAHRLLRKAGVDLPFLAWSDAVEGSPRKCRDRDWPGVWQHLYDDARYAIRRLGTPPRRVLRALVRYPARPRTYAVGSRSDPRPFLAQWNFVGRRVQAMRRRMDTNPG
jgi:predicted ATP-grasp superfamily ATP-dependent carboligase